MKEYTLKTGKTGKKVVEGYREIEGKFTDRFLEEDENSPSGYSLKTGRTADVVTGVYKKIEKGVTGAYQKIEDAFVEHFLEEKGVYDDEEK